MRTPNKQEAFLIDLFELMYPFIKAREEIIKYCSKLSKEFSKIVESMNKIKINK